VAPRKLLIPVIGFDPEETPRTTSSRRPASQLWRATICCLKAPWRWITLRQT